ncbi:putative arabinose transporter [compost metagenome]
MLILFGASGIIGNMQAAKYVSRNMVKTIICYPLVLGAIYCLIYYLGSYSIPMSIIIVIWGAVFTGGLIVSQTWLTSEASEAPEFANSLFVSFGNLGITIGTTIGGWFLSQMGTYLIAWSGVFFLLLASACIWLKIKLFDSKKGFEASAENLN